METGKTSPYEFTCLGHYDKEWAPCQVCVLKEECIRKKVETV